MSDTVRLSSKLAGDEEVNGLDSLAPQLLENPNQVTCALVWMTVRHITEDVEHGSERVPTVQIRRIEPIATVDKVPQAVQELAAQLYEARLNKTPLPFGVVKVVEGGYLHPDETPMDD